jgi:hypothetical protein
VPLQADGLTERVTVTARLALADADARFRIVAIDVLGRLGTLEDVGLLSDLPALPPQADEHPDERAALAGAMRAIAEAE